MAVEAKAPLWCYTESFPSNGGNINLLGHTQWQLPNKSLPQLDGISFLLHTVMLSSMAQPWRLSSIHFCVNLRDLEAPTYLSITNFFAFSQVGVKHLKPQRTLLMLHIHTQEGYLHDFCLKTFW